MVASYKLDYFYLTINDNCDGKQIVFIYEFECGVIKTYHGILVKCDPIKQNEHINDINYKNPPKIIDHRIVSRCYDLHNNWAGGYLTIYKNGDANIKIYGSGRPIVTEIDTKLCKLDQVIKFDKKQIKDCSDCN
jgi:hypothetical protein